MAGSDPLSTEMFMGTAYAITADKEVINMQTIGLRAEIDEHNEIRFKVPAGYAHQWARIHVSLPDHGNADADQKPVIPPTTEVIRRQPLKMGLFRGRIHMADDFNDPLPDSNR